MAALYETMTDTLIKVLKFSNYIFTAIFILEATLKLIAFGLSYFNNSWNRFDFFVVMSSIFDLFLESMENNSLEWLSVGP